MELGGKWKFASDEHLPAVDIKKFLKSDCTIKLNAGGARHRASTDGLTLVLD